MTFDEYQVKARETAVYPDGHTGSLAALSYCALGLGEVGEVQGKIKKLLRGDEVEVTHAAKIAIIQELGDVLWYVAMLADELGYDFDDVARLNLAKLSDRKEAGTIKGSGDNR